MMISKLYFVGLALWLMTADVLAQDFKSRRIIPLELANEAAMAAIAACAKNGFDVTATLVDANGIVRSVSKAEMAGPHTNDSSRLKAFTAVSLGPTFRVDTTGEIAAKAQSSPSGAALSVVPGFMIFAGGALIRSRGEVLGALGVGGAGNGDKDQICVQAAIDQIADRLK
jgi:uncharacterized protein GlcG (DUF336 family)